MSRNSATKYKDCYRCGAPANSKEHVVPKCLFPKISPVNFITVPACQHCNNALAKDEEYFRTVLASSWNASQAARSVWDEKIVASFKPGRDGLRKIIAGEIGEEIYLPSGVGFVKTAIMRPRAARLDRVAEKIVRGLYYHVTSRRMPEDSYLRFHWQRPDWLPNIALQAPLISLDPDVFSCRYAITSGMNPELSIWWLLFYKSVMYIVNARVAASDSPNSGSATMAS